MLPHEELVDIASRLQAVLFLDLDEDGNDAWNRDKEWSLDTLEDIGRIADDHDLRPTERLDY